MTRADRAVRLPDIESPILIGFHDNGSKIHFQKACETTPETATAGHPPKTKKTRNYRNTFIYK